MEEHFDTEAKDMLMQLMGQTYGELHKLDSFIVGPSQQLQHKSEAFKQTVANVTRAINSNVPQSEAPRRVIRPEPAAASHVVADQQLVHDPNQMELGFDDSVTAKSIDKYLSRIEDKIDRLAKVVNKLIDSQKK